MRTSAFARYLAVALLMASSGGCRADAYRVAFSTYLGGTGAEDTARAVAVDTAGNIYVAGGTASADFPTTAGAYDRTFATGGGSTGSRGPMDVFVTKLDPRGRIVWSTLLGGPNYDRAYTVRVDRQGFVYVGGRAGEGFPTTPGTVQPEFAGDSSGLGAYGKQDGFLAKISPDGSRLVWATYFGTPCGSIIRDFDLDPAGDIHLVMLEVREPCRHVTQGAFQDRMPGGLDSIVAKVSADGRRVLWCTYLGGTGRDLAPSLRVGADAQPIVAGSTFSTDFPVTQGCYQRQLRGAQDAFVTKLKADGSGLVYSTLIGGSDEDGAAGKHGLAIDTAGRACVSGFTFSADFPVPGGAYQSRYGGATAGDWRQRGDFLVAVLSADGSRLDAATYIGGSAHDGGEGIAVDAGGRIYVSGATFSSDLPTTTGAPQGRFAGAERPHGPQWGGGDAAAFVLAPDLRRALLATYLGGSGEDLFRAVAVTRGGDVVLVGSSTSSDWPITNATQASRAGGPDEVIVVKLSPDRPLAR